ncbi:MAG: ABC transporter permease [Ignavibacteriae bacterium]|nr:ABC transporter permease [Ignavibacteriota bacterium]
MKFSEITENIKIAFEAMRVNKLRSLLASLGVVIGISFVILMGWVLSGLDQALEDTFNIIGTDMLYIDKWDWAGGRNWKKIRQRKDITYDQATEFCEKIKNAELAIPNAREFGYKIKYKNEEFQGMSFIGTRWEHSMTPAGSTYIGRHFTQFEDDIGSNVIVLGYKVHQALLNEGDPLGQYVKIEGRKFLVIGVIKKQGTMLFDFVDNQCFMPIKAFQSVFGRSGRSVSVAIKAGSINSLDEVRAESEGLMRQIRNIKPGEENDFSINETKAFESTVEVLRLSVWSVGIGMTVLSFLVGIIGIMNIMFVSVTERTKEIGIRKAVGAKKRTIWMQFIIEAAILSFIGAVIAFIGCSVFVYLIATLLPKFVPETAFLSPILPYELLLIASFVSIFVGMLAGLVPAVRAANLDPVEALRREN